MNLRTLRELVKQGEGEHLEFKLKNNHPDKIVRELVAFANSGGGKLLLGVSDDRLIEGLRYPDEDEFTLVKAIESYCSPPIHYVLERVPLAHERAVLAISIPSSKNKPHYVSEKVSGTKKAFVRVGERSIQASREMREIMRRSRSDANTWFNYGEKESKLMQFLETGEIVTVDTFAAYAGITRAKASDTLVMLVLAGVIKVHPNEIADHYTGTSS